MRYLLDSNIVIALMAHHAEATRHLSSLRPGEAGLSSLVLHELMFGAFNSRRIEENLRRLELLSFPMLPFDEQDARAAGEIRAELKRKGTPIGPYDVLIAGQALARDLTLVTANTREFARVPGLKIANWLAEHG